MLEGQFYSVSWIESDLLEKLNCLKLGGKVVLRQNFSSIVIQNSLGSFMFLFFVTSVVFMIYLNVV